jgi:hypothetical protein
MMTTHADVINTDILAFIKGAPVKDCLMLGRQRATCSLWGWAHAASVNRANLTRLLFWEQALMRHYIRPAAVKVGITKRIGWQTFRHSYSTLLKASGADIKVMQELLRHASTPAAVGFITANSASLIMCRVSSVNGAVATM